MNVTAIASGPTTLLVHWNPPPPEEQNGDIMQYGLNITNMELGDTTTHYLSGSRTSFILQNLRPHNVYQYRMTAYTAVGNGPYSPSQTIQMPSAGSYIHTAPPNPTGNMLYQRTLSELHTHKATSDPFENEFHKIVQHLHAHRITSFTLCPFAAPSSPPLNLSLDEVGSSYALLRWSPPPQRDHNGVIQNYVIHRNSSRGEVVNVHTAGPETHLLMSSLQPNTKYSCGVAAVTVSPGPRSTTINFTTNTSGIAAHLHLLPDEIEHNNNIMTVPNYL